MRLRPWLVCLLIAVCAGLAPLRALATAAAATTQSTSAMPCHGLTAAHEAGTSAAASCCGLAGCGHCAACHMGSALLAQPVLFAAAGEQQAWMPQAPPALGEVVQPVPKPPPRGALIHRR